MLIPINTDAPIYHFPAMTIGLIVINFVGFVLTAGGNPEHVDRWAQWSLQYGDGLHPVQWVTSNFVHMGFGHLLGNMIFLWTFGLVVEGKLGWWKFLLVYLAIGSVQCAMEQTIMLGYDHEVIFFDEDLKPASLPGSCGASAIIYGLLAIAMVWAPVNEIKCFIMFGFRAAIVDISIMIFAVLDLSFQLIIATLQQFSMATAMLHLMGAFVGFGVGIVLLKRGVVDGEDWDLFSVMSGHYGPYARDRFGNRVSKEEKESQDRKQKEKYGLVKSKKTKAPPVDEDMRSIGQLIDDGSFEQASDEFWALRVSRNVELTRPRLNQLISGLLEYECWEDATTLMEEYVERFPKAAVKMQLPLARIQLTKLKEPREALQTLKSVNREELSEKQTVLFKKLARSAKAKLA